MADTKVQEYDSQHGSYKETVTEHSMEDLLPMKEMPQAPDPSPFKLGPMAPGKRE